MTWGPQYRFVVLVDVEADSLASAYTKVHKGMQSSFPGDWESTDEAFDEDGERVSEADVQRARGQGLWRTKGQKNPSSELKRKLMR